MHDTAVDLRRASDRHYLRKIKKPLIEKRRRDRINSSLEQLKSILLVHIKQHGGVQTSRLDKADILEFTVQYLAGKTGEGAANKTRYSSGFRDCARETFRYLGDACAVPDAVTSRLRDHLVQTETTQRAEYDNNGSTPKHRLQDTLSIEIPTAHVPTTAATRTGSSSWNEHLLIPVTYYNRDNHEECKQVSVHAQMSPDSGVDTSSYSAQEAGDSDTSESEPCDTGVWRPW